MKSYKWLVWEKVEMPNCDYCSWVPDIIFGFPFYKACKLHDYLYRGILLGLTGDGNLKRIARRRADYLFLDRLNNIVWAYGMSPIHRITGYVIAFFYFLGVRLFGWLSYSKK